MKWLVALVFTAVAHAEQLKVVETVYRPAASAPSCGLLKHRERERQKVLRELEHLAEAELGDGERALVFTGDLLTNKMFMPRDVWIDDSVQVEVLVRIPDGLLEEIQRLGLENVFLSLDAPGFVWQSLAGQLPDEVQVAMDADSRTLHWRYPVYLNVLCGELSTPEVLWIAEPEVHAHLNSNAIFAKMPAPFCATRPPFFP